METLLKQLRELPARLAALPAGVRYALIGGSLVAVIAAVAVGTATRGGGDYQYVYSDLSTEDTSESGNALKAAAIPYRIEANGTALAVPADKLYDARVLLATAGLPRNGPADFEKIYGQGSDIGVSEATQKINLLRATQGELAKSIGKFEGVKSARVSLSFGERGFYKGEDKKPSATVVVNLQPGRTLGERELAGVRHLVASAVPGLSHEQVTVLDNRGAVLSGDTAWNSAEATFQRNAERDLEQKVVAMLTPIVGADAVIARVSASFDFSQVNQNAEVVDPDAVVLTGETTTTGSSNSQSNQPQMVTGAVANVPLAPQQPQNGPTQQSNTSNNSTSKTYVVSKTTTQTQARIPRPTRLSVSVLVDGKDGKPRSAEEIARLTEIARKAVGFDELRGDQFELSSVPFEKPIVPEAPVVAAVTPTWQYIAGGAGLLAALIVAFVIFRRATKKPVDQLVLQPGSTVAALEAKQNAIDGVAVPMPEPEPEPVLVDPLMDIKDKARALLRADNERALMLVRAWLSADLEKAPDQNRNEQPNG